MTESVLSPSAWVAPQRPPWWGVLPCLLLLPLCGVLCALAPEQAPLLLGFVLFLLVCMFNRTLAAALLIPLALVPRGTLGLQILPHTHGFVMVDYYAHLPLFLPVAAGALLTLPATLDRRREHRELLFIFLLLLVFCYAAVTVLWSPIPRYSLTCLGIMASGLALLTVLYAAVDSPRSARRLAYLFVCMVVLQGIGALLCHFLGDVEERHTLDWQVLEGLNLRLMAVTGYLSEDGRFNRLGGVVPPNIMSAHFNLGLILALGLLVRERRLLLRLLLAVGAVFLVFMVLGTMSRAGAAVLVGSPALFLILSRRVRPLCLLTLPLLLFVVVGTYKAQNAMIGALMGGAYTPRLEGRSEDQVKSGNVDTDRQKWWRKGLKALRDTGYLGTATATFHTITGMFYAHSLYMSYLIEFGLVGLGLFLLACAYLLSRYLALLHHQESFAQAMNPAFLAGFVGLLVHGLVDFDYLDMHTWAFLGLALGFVRLAREEVAATRASGPAGEGAERPCAPSGLKSAV